MGEEQYDFQRKNAPGYYRNCEMIPLLLGSSEQEYVQKTAQKILSLQDENPGYVKFDQDGNPLRKFYKAKDPKRQDFHSTEYPSTYVNPNDILVNQINPYSGIMKPWEIELDDDPLEKALSHLTCDSLFTVEMLKIDRVWLEKAANNDLAADERKPGLLRGSFKVVLAIFKNLEPMQEFFIKNISDN